MYIPKKYWLKKEKSLKNKLHNGVYTNNNEIQYVKDVVRISELKNTQPWLIAAKYPTTNYSECSQMSNFNDDKSDSFCSCWNGVHEELHFTRKIIRKTESEDWE